MDEIISKIDELKNLEEGWDDENSLAVKQEYIDIATQIANQIFERHCKKPTFVAPTSSSGVLLEYSTSNDRIDIRIGDVPYIYINYINNKKFEGKKIPFSMEYIDSIWNQKSEPRERKVIETNDRVKLSYPLLMALGFKKHKTAIIETNNYIKGDFKINDALPRFFYKGEMLPEIKYLDELCKIYFEKTGQSLKLNHKYGR